MKKQKKMEVRIDDIVQKVYFSVDSKGRIVIDEEGIMEEVERQLASIIKAVNTIKV